MKASPSPRTQATTIKYIELIAQTHGYQVQARKKDPKGSPDEKTFLPDVIATRHIGKSKRVFEVEATVTNNTIYKSLLSLLTALKNGATNAYLVVPDKRVDFAAGCYSNLKTVILHFSKLAKGPAPKIKLDILGFSDISRDYKKAKEYETKSRCGQPPKCAFLPRR